MAGEQTVGRLVSLQRGLTYKGSLVDKPGPALLGLGSIIPGGGFRDDHKTYGGECPPHLMLGPGDLFVSLKGATKDGEMIGSIARVPECVASGRLTQDTVGLKFREDKRHLISFLYWVLRTPQYRDYCRGRATGSAVVALSRDDFLCYPVPEHTPARARLVALFDEIEAKIDLNRRRSRTLEAMARAIFQSWFVDFDPVRAKAAGHRPPGLTPAVAALFPDRFEDSPLGPIPAGWQVGTIRKAISIFDSTRIPLSNRQREERRGPYPYYGAASQMDSVDDYLFDGVYVLMGEDGSVVTDDGTPVLQYVWGKFWVNNHAHVLQGAGGITTEHLLLHLKTCNIVPFVTGAVQPKLNQGNMNRISFLYADDAINCKFGEIIAPQFAQLRLAHKESRALAALRDALLPELISGDVRIPDAERMVGSCA